MAGARARARARVRVTVRVRVNVRVRVRARARVRAAVETEPRPDALYMPVEAAVPSNTRTPSVGQAAALRRRSYSEIVSSWSPGVLATSALPPTSLRLGSGLVLGPG